jgi:demethylmenaquinone methyltransferase/2-methoxy-6-polyprenyl-1,4-benzoquinol methylase
MESRFSAQDSSSIQRLFARIASRYDLANAWLSAGLDSSWRRYVGRRVAPWHPSILLDVATGSGVLAVELGRQNPTARIVGIDFCAPMLELAQRRGLSELIVADGMALPFANEVFDVVTVAFGLRNMASLRGALTEFGRVLRPGGRLVTLDFSIPAWPLRGPYRIYLHRILPRLAGWLTGEPNAYRYLGDSIETFPSGESMLSLLRSCGFAECEHRPLSGGIVSVYVGRKEQ